MRADEAAASRLGEIIARRKIEIEKRWRERVLVDVAASPGVELTQLRDGMPDYLDALVKLLQSGAYREDHGLMSAGAWTEVAREHGITRVRIGFDINQLVHEFIVLRQVIRDVASETGVAELPMAGGLLASLIESAIAAAVSAYVEARDFEGRRVQAENIAFLTHELRNPLSTAMLSASQLRLDCGAEAPKSLEVLERSLRRIAGLIDSVLLTQQLEVVEPKAKREPVKLASYLEQVLESARLAAERKQIGFRVVCDRELEARLDPELTRSAIQNLADNAVKYTDEGEVSISVDERDANVEVHVRDNCHGLSPEELRIVFEPFRRGNTRKSGTGLGLAIAKRMIEAQGGTIAAESPEGRGCHFWITLPKAPAAETAPSSDSGHEPTQAGR